MYFCISCKQQFGDAQSRYGDCPFCGTVNMMAQTRKQLESKILNDNSASIKRLMSYIDRKKLGR